MRKLSDFTPVQQLLITSFVMSNGQVDLRDVPPVIVMIENGSIEFAAVDTANEHLHIPHLPKDANMFCTQCAHVTPWWLAA